jgi:hypothetical protein
MAIKQLCSCGKRYSIHKDYVGKWLECGVCGRKFMVGKVAKPKRRLREVFARKKRSRAGEKLFYECLCQVLDDGVLTLAEEKELNSIANEYGLTPKRVQTLKTAYMKNKYREAMADGIVTEEEDNSLDRLFQELNLPEGLVLVNSGKYYRMWLIGQLQERGPVALPSPRVRLPKGEECYWETGALVIEKTKKTITKYSGTVYLTNKKILFVGSGITKKVTWKNFLNYEFNTFGSKVHIYQSNRVNPLELRVKDPELFTMYIDAILDSVQ